MRAILDTDPSLPLIAVFPEHGELSAEVSQLGVAVHIGSVPRWADFGHRGYRRRIELWKENLTAVIAALRVLQAYRPVAVVTNTMTVPCFAIAARILNIPHYWMIHEFGDSRDHDLQFLIGYSQTMRLIRRLSRVAICCSHAVEKSVKGSDYTVKTCVVYGGVDLQEARPRPRVDGMPIRYILFGRFSQSKGQEFAVRAFALALEQRSDMRLTLIGPSDPSPLERIQALVDDLGIADRVDIHAAWTSPDAVWRYADVALMCSRHEAFGRVTVEAMRSGIPICGTQSGGTTEIVEHEINGLLSPPDDIRGFASNMLRLAGDEPMRLRLAEAATRRASEFSAERYGRELLAILRGRRSAPC